MFLSPEIIKVIVTGLTLGGAGTIIYQCKAVPLKIYEKIKQSLIYNVTIYQYDDLFYMLEDWLRDKHESKYRDVEASVDEKLSAHPTYDGVYPDKKVSYKQEDNLFILKYKGKNLIFNKNKEKLEKAQSLKDVYFRKYVISGIRAKQSIDELLKEVLDFNKKKNIKNSVQVSYNDAYGEWARADNIKVKPIDKTIINESKKELLLNDLKRFTESEDWYANVCIPYKRGYCFFGPPGTGKTTLALSIANYLGRSIHALNLNSITDDSRLPVCFNKITPNSVLLIEDIDKVFSGRDNVQENSKITFSSLLNCLDGAFYKHGLITIITTNHIDKLDEALIRTGRIDVKMEISKPTDREINEYFKVFFNIPLNIKGNFDLKMSDVQEICLKNRECPQQAKIDLINRIM